MNSHSHGAAALDVVRNSIATHGKSFAFASRALPVAVRDDVAAVYAYCRRADDAVDTVAPTLAALAIDELDAELRAVYASEPQSDPVLSAFQNVVFKYAIPRHYPEELLAGMRMDVSGVTYRTLPELLEYCYRVAGTVGLMMCHVLGVSDPDALRPAAHLGMAMQLTNVCRDVHEDWQRGRLYLPADLVRGFGFSALTPRGQPLARNATAALATTTRLLLGWANVLYESGEKGVRFLPPRAALAVRTARHVYADIGNVIAARGCDPFAPRAIVPNRRKLSLGARAFAQTLAERRPAFRRAHIEDVIGVTDVLCV